MVGSIIDQAINDFDKSVENEECSYEDGSPEKDLWVATQESCQLDRSLTKDVEHDVLFQKSVGAEEKFKQMKIKPNPDMSY